MLITLKKTETTANVDIQLVFFLALRDMNLSNNKFHELPKGEFILLPHIMSNPLHPNISMHILLTFPWMLIRRICLTIKSFFSW